MRKWFEAYWATVVVLFTGPASIIFDLIAALSDTLGKAVGFWVAGYSCMVLSTGVIIYKMHMKLKELEAGGLTVERRRLAQDKLRGLSAREREALRVLLIEAHLTGDQVREKFPDGNEVDFTRINERTPFLVLELVLHDIGRTTDSWSIRPEWQGVLASLLVAPQVWSFWAKQWRRFLYVIRTIGKRGVSKNASTHKP